MKRTITLSASALAIFLAGVSFAQAEYPERPITMVVAYSAGGSTDVAARTLVPYIEKNLDGATINVLNRPGAGGEIGFTELSRAKPDGYTIGFINAPTVVTLPIQRQTRYSLDSFDPLANVTYDPGTFAVRSDSDFKNLEDLVSYAKEHPGEVTYGTTGIGNDDHLAALAFEKAAGIDMEHVPFPGDSDVRAALLGGHVKMASVNVGSMVSDLGEGNVILLGQMSEERIKAAFEIPTFSEQGYDMVLGAYRGIAVPEGIPAEIADKLGKAIESAMQDPEFQAQAKKQDMFLSFKDSEALQGQLNDLETKFKSLWEEDPWIQQ